MLGLKTSIREIVNNYGGRLLGLRVQLFIAGKDVRIDDYVYRGILGGVFVSVVTVRSFCVGV